MFRLVILPVLLSLVIVASNTAVVVAGPGKNVFIVQMEFGRVNSHLLGGQPYNHFQTRSVPDRTIQVTHAYTNATTAASTISIQYPWYYPFPVPVNPAQGIYHMGFQMGDPVFLLVLWDAAQCFPGPSVSYSYDFEAQKNNLLVVNTSPENLLAYVNYDFSKPEGDLAAGQWWTRSDKESGFVVMSPDIPQKDSPRPCLTLSWAKNGPDHKVGPPRFASPKP